MNPMPGGSVDNCITFQPVQNHVVIGDDHHRLLEVLPLHPDAGSTRLC